MIRLFDFLSKRRLIVLHWKYKKILLNAFVIVDMTLENVEA